MLAELLKMNRMPRTVRVMLKPVIVHLMVSASRKNRSFSWFFGFLMRVCFFFIHQCDIWTGEGGFLCDENRCLRKQVLCDGLAQCKDGSDESLDRCAAVTCPADKFQCKHSKQCIPRSFLCDGNADCNGTKNLTRIQLQIKKKIMFLFLFVSIETRQKWWNGKLYWMPWISLQ